MQGVPGEHVVAGVELEAKQDRNYTIILLESSSLRWLTYLLMKF